MKYIFHYANIRLEEKVMNSLLDYFMDKSKQDFDIDIVKYGCKLLMSSVVGTLIVLFFALIICKIEDAIIFLITFAFLRKYSGGYHCSTYVRCNFLLLITYFGSVLWMMVEMEIFEYILVLISLAYIVLKAPIKNKNKILNYKQLMKIRKNIKIITLIYFSIMILCWLLSIKSVLGYSIVLTALLMIGG